MIVEHGGCAVNCERMVVLALKAHLRVMMKAGHTKDIFACFASSLWALRLQLLTAKAAEHTPRAQS